MRRKTTEEERTLFKKHIDEPRPLKAAVVSKTKKVKAVAATLRKLPATPNKLDGNTAEKLRRGELAPGARIDLHGMTEAAAHGALLSFLSGAQSRGIRLVLVITGVGNPKDQDNAEWMRASHGVLKQMVPRWLNEKSFAALHAGSGPAHRRHGGNGALYVYLRKKRMRQAFHTVRVVTQGPGLYEFTDAVAAFAAGEKLDDGLLTCFIRHTSASLVVQENADPDVLKDLQDFFARLAKKGMDYRHSAEGPDDMPSHIRAALTATSIAIPVKRGKPVLGTWQGLYVFEHRDAAHMREVLLHFIGD